ncbi:MAG: hypothetical protein ACHQAX_03650 [Gammaproteobacteria bacterium]
MFENINMLKPQDCVILLKLLAHPGQVWSQRDLAKALCISLSEVNAGIRRLGISGLLRKDVHGQLYPNIDAAEEFLVSGLKFFFPGKLGEYTRGTPTAVGAPIFQDKIVLGDDPLPVWPDAMGAKRGVALAPIHPAIPQALKETPDKLFYELLVIIDTIRSGKARERNIAVTLLKERLKNEKS